MSATVKVTLVDSGNTTKNISLTIPHEAKVAGTIDIPDMTASATVFAVPFGSVDVDATAVLIQNTNNQDMGIRLNSAVADEFQLAPGGMLLHAAPAAAGANPLLALDVVTTAEQSGAGQVAYWVFGDPV